MLIYFILIRLTDSFLGVLSLNSVRLESGSGGPIKWRVCRVEEEPREVKYLQLLRDLRADILIGVAQFWV